jgi:Bifunctional DNA primase/polymerase, N-terminal
MTPRLMGRALRLAELGWQVFPLRPGDKRPLPGFTNWEKRATTDPGQIIQWWTEAPYNIGIATGTSGLLVIDCDTSQDTDSPQWCLVGENVQIAGKALPRTLTVATPNGGRHLYFSAKGRSLSNSVGKLGRHIDTRGNGGYVVGPGSVLEAGYYRIVSRRSVAELPDWIADALTQQSFIVPATSLGELRESDVKAILEREVERVRTATPGSRNSALNIAAFVLGKLVGIGKITERDAWKILQAAAHSHIGHHGFTESEMNRTICSGLSAGIRPGS